MANINTRYKYKYTYSTTNTIYIHDSRGEPRGSWWDPECYVSDEGHPKDTADDPDAAALSPSPSSAAAACLMKRIASKYGAFPDSCSHGGGVSFSCAPALALAKDNPEFGSL